MLRKQQRRDHLTPALGAIEVGGEDRHAALHRHHRYAGLEREQVARRLDLAFGKNAQRRNGRSSEVILGEDSGNGSGSVTLNFNHFLRSPRSYDEFFFIKYASSR